MNSPVRLDNAPVWGRPGIGGTDRVPRADGPSDLVVVGAGFSALVAAIEAARSGARVCLVSGTRSCSAELPGWMTPLHGETPHQIRLLHGEPTVRSWVAQLQRAADYNGQLSGDLDVKFEPRDFSISSVDGHWAFQQRFAARALRAAGQASWSDDRSGLPFPIRPELIVSDGAVVDPVRWLDALTFRAVELGVRFVPGVLSGLRVHRGLATVDAGLATLQAPRVILAGPVPLADRALLRARVRRDQWHLLAIRTDELPYRELQLLDRPVTIVSRWGDHLVLGQRGGRATALIDWLSRRFTDAEVTHSWSTTTTRSLDSLPLVGAASLSGDTVLTANGFDGFPLATGTAAGLQLADVVLGRCAAEELPWKPLRAVTWHGLSKRVRSAAIGPIPWITRLNEPRLRD